MSKIKQLLEMVKSKEQFEVVNQQTIPIPNLDEIRKLEVFEVLKLGYWPVKFLSQTNHWLSKGQSIDDTFGAPTDDQEICGYEYHSWIQDKISIDMCIYQGNSIHDLDGVKETTLEFRCCNLDPDGDLWIQQRYTINQYQQIDVKIEQHWAQFVEQAWPMVNEEMTKFIAQTRTRKELDSNTHADFIEFAWRHFNQLHKDQLKQCVFLDWFAIDAVNNWYRYDYQTPKK